ncbi:MAG: hypothetical protein K8R21_08660 [Leptospira sp.]|nr:hypothetical protein [Leptospira sp.]
MKSKIAYFYLFSSALIAEPAFKASPTLENMNDLKTDRLAFHYSNQIDPKGKNVKGTHPFIDNSEATLVVIKGGETYILKDGYDDPTDTSRKKNEYNEKLNAYKERLYFLKDFQEIDAQRSKRALHVGSFGKPLEEYDSELLRILVRNDLELRKLVSSVKSAESEEESRLRGNGASSAQYKEAKQKKEEAATRMKERAEFLKSALRNINKPDSKEKLSEIKSPGSDSDQEFFTNQMDGNPDYFLYARSSGHPDFTRVDKPGKTFVQTTYSKMFQELRNKLIQAHIDKYKNYISNLNSTNSKIQIEQIPIPADPAILKTDESNSGKPQENKGVEKKPVEPASTGNRPQLTSKKITLIGGDSTRYVLIDADGDGICESVFVSNPDVKFRWEKDAPNIIAIQNCKDPQISAMIKDLVENSISGDFGTLESAKSPKTDIRILVPEEELVPEAGTYLNKK